MLFRCPEHGPPNQQGYARTLEVKPVGYPESPLICGRSECGVTALVYLDNEETNLYDHGKRVFWLPGEEGYAIEVGDAQERHERSEEEFVETEAESALDV